MVLKSSLSLCATFILVGCLASQPARRLPQGTPLSVLLALASHDGRGHAFPPSVKEAIADALAARGFEPEFIGVGDENTGKSSISDFERLGAKARLAKLGELAPASSWVLVIDVNVRFFSQLTGRFRWDVALELQLARRDALEVAERVGVTLPAFLQYEHEREPEAVDFVRRQIVTELGGLLDSGIARDAGRSPR